MNGARFTAVEYLALVAAVDRLQQEGAEEGSEWMRQDVLGAERALRKVHSTLTPAQRREVDRRIGR